MKYEFELQGKPPSKKNRYSVGNGRFYQDQGVRAWMDGAIWELTGQRGAGKTFPIINPVSLQVTFYTDNRSDIDNQLSTIFDALQSGGVLKNDRQIYRVFAIRERELDVRKQKTLITIEVDGDNSRLRKTKK